jgi:hypothetical protein
MLDLYVLYACVHLIAGKHSHEASKTQCVEGQVFFHAEECKKRVPKKGGGVTQKSRHSVSWLECKETRADSWIPADATDSGTRLYKAEASVSDQSALAALLAPLSPQARATLKPGDFTGRFERTFQGPGNLSFFIVGTGSSVFAYAVSNLDDFQFTDMATDMSSSSAAMATTEEDLDVASMAQDAGVQLSYHTETSQRAMPPPGGVETEP